MNKTLRNLLVISLFFAILLSIFSFEKPGSDDDFTKNESKVSVPFFRESQEQNLLSPDALSRLYPDEYIFEEEIEVPKGDGPVVCSEWKYVSTIRQSDITSYYFKNTGTGRVLALSEKGELDLWNLITIEKDFFILQSQEVLYKVMK